MARLPGVPIEALVVLVDRVDGVQARIAGLQIPATRWAARYFGFPSFGFDLATIEIKTGVGRVGIGAVHVVESEHRERCDEFAVEELTFAAELVLLTAARIEWLSVGFEAARRHEDLGVTQVGGDVLAHVIDQGAVGREFVIGLGAALPKRCGHSGRRSRTRLRVVVAQAPTDDSRQRIRQAQAQLGVEAGLLG